MVYGVFQILGHQKRDPIPVFKYLLNATLNCAFSRTRIVRVNDTLSAIFMSVLYEIFWKHERLETGLWRGFKFLMLLMCTHFGMKKWKVLANNLINKSTVIIFVLILFHKTASIIVCIMLNNNWYNDYKMTVGKNEVESIHGYLTPKNILRESWKPCKPSLK
jgi:hypothetical protein